MGPTFDTDHDVTYGAVEQLSPLVRRVTAENPSKFTFKGTGTYILGHGEGVTAPTNPLAVSPDGRWIASGVGTEIRIGVGNRVRPGNRLGDEQIGMSLQKAAGAELQNGSD